MQTRNNAYIAISALAFLAIMWYYNKFYTDLKAVSCTIEWSLFKVRSPKHASVIIFIMNYYHKATIVALQLQRVNQESIMEKRLFNSHMSHQNEPIKYEPIMNPWLPWTNSLCTLLGLGWFPQSPSKNF